MMLASLFILPTIPIGFLGTQENSVGFRGVGLNTSHYNPLENFEAYTAGTDLNGKIGPLGSWITYVTGAGCYCKVYNDGGNKVIDAKDVSTTGGASAEVFFDIKGSINGINIVSWRQKVLAENFNILVMEGSNIRVQVQFSGGNLVRYYAPDHGGLFNTGLTFGTGWETYEVMLYSTSQFMLRQYKNGTWSAWVGPFDLRNHWSSTGAVCSAWDIEGGTPVIPRVFVDNVGVRWYGAPEIIVNSPIASSMLGSGNVSLNINVVGINISSIWYCLDHDAPVLMPANTSILVH